jgi:hypothetical protein
MLPCSHSNPSLLAHRSQKSRLWPTGGALWRGTVPCHCRSAAALSGRGPGAPRECTQSHLCRQQQGRRQGSQVLVVACAAARCEQPPEESEQHRAMTHTWHWRDAAAAKHLKAAAQGGDHQLQPVGGLDTVQQLRQHSRAGARGAPVAGRRRSAGGAWQHSCISRRRP